LKTKALNWYTHTDLNYAKNILHYKLELIEDNEVNALLYTELRQCKTLFEPFIDYLFEFKQKGITEIKKYINCLLGALCEKDIITMKTKTIRENQELVMLKPNFKKKSGNVCNVTCSIAKKGFLYKTNYVRIEPFLVASGRLIISNIIRVNLDSVVRVHTDGVILKEPVKDVKLGTDIGQLKYEGVGYCEIINGREYTFNAEEE